MTSNKFKLQDIQSSKKILSNFNLVIDEDNMFHRGKGKICEVDEKIVEFAITNLIENNIWALFIAPEFEGIEIGGKLHNLVLDWYF